MDTSMEEALAESLNRSQQINEINATFERHGIPVEISRWCSGQMIAVGDLLLIARKLDEVRRDQVESTAVPSAKAIDEEIP